ncbi:VOC family protein [Primorskyibacter sp. S87]|uniref:VOC family protein n=1 Tax=Primorskyibacter sp. S87 TaxID=3415126 RepID=UPI003C7CE4E6
MELDHLAVAGRTLDEATTHVEEALGVSMVPGGKHAHFGTHNRLLGLQGGLYLEAIAIDPSAPPPEDARWFDLDRLQGGPHLRNWICRVQDFSAVPEAAGTPVSLRRGDLRWQMAVPETGILPFDNLYPALIRWQGRLHPAELLPDSGCSLRRLLVSHPEAEALRAAVARLTDGRVVLTRGPAGLRAEIDTPHGLRVLE